MGMEWFIILLIWLVAPFAELAAIIVLAVANSRYKRRIWELTRETDKADTETQDKGPADIKIQYEGPADIKIQYEGPADTEIQHERPADAVTQHEKSAAWYGPGQAIVGVYFKGRKPLPCPAGRQHSHGNSSFFQNQKIS